MAIQQIGQNNLYLWRHIAFFIGLLLLVVATPVRGSVFATTPNPFPVGGYLDINSASSFHFFNSEVTNNLFLGPLDPITSFYKGAGFEFVFDPSLSTTFVDGSSMTLSLPQGIGFGITIGGGYNPVSNFVGTFPETFDYWKFEGTSATGLYITCILDPWPGAAVTISPALDGYQIDNSTSFKPEVDINANPTYLPNLNGSLVTLTDVPEPKIIGIATLVTVLAAAFRRLQPS